MALTNHKNGDIRREIVLRVSIAGKHKRVSRDALLPGRGDYGDHLLRGRRNFYTHS